MRTFLVSLRIACVLAMILPGASSAFGQAAGEPRAGGRAETNVRFMLPPSDGVTEPKWSADETARGYVVYSDSYLKSHTRLLILYASF